MNIDNVGMPHLKRLDDVVTGRCLIEVFLIEAVIYMNSMANQKTSQKNISKKTKDTVVSVDNVSRGVIYLIAFGLDKAEVS